MRRHGRASRKMKWLEAHTPPRANIEKLSVSNALERFTSEVTPTKSPTTQTSEIQRARHLKGFFDKYSLAVLNTDIICDYRDKRQKQQHSPIRTSFIGHRYITAIKEWRIGIEVNPVHNVRKPSGGSGRNRRLRWILESQPRFSSPHSSLYSHAKLNRK